MKIQNRKDGIVTNYLDPLEAALKALPQHTIVAFARPFMLPKKNGELIITQESNGKSSVSVKSVSTLQISPPTKELVIIQAKGSAANDDTFQKLINNYYDVNSQLPLRIQGNLNPGQFVEDLENKDSVTPEEAVKILPCYGLNVLYLPKDSTALTGADSTPKLDDGLALIKESVTPAEEAVPILPYDRIDLPEQSTPLTGEDSTPKLDEGFELI